MSFNFSKTYGLLLGMRCERPVGRYGEIPFLSFNSFHRQDGSFLISTQIASALPLYSLPMITNQSLLYWTNHTRIISAAFFFLILNIVVNWLHFHLILSIICNTDTTALRTEWQITSILKITSNEFRKKETSFFLPSCKSVKPNLIYANVYKYEQVQKSHMQLFLRNFKANIYFRNSVIFIH